MKIEKRQRMKEIIQKKERKRINRLFTKSFGTIGIVRRFIIK